MDKVTIKLLDDVGQGHERGTHYMMTGFEPLPGFAPAYYGSVASKMLPELLRLTSIAIPQPVMYGGAGLGAALGPFKFGGDPVRLNFKVRDLELPPGMTVELDGRRAPGATRWTRSSPGSKRAATVCGPWIRFISGPTRCCPPPRRARGLRPFQRGRTRCATRTDGRSSGRGCCWRGGSSRAGCAS